MCWLDLFSQVDNTIHHVPGKSNVVTDACCIVLTFATVVGSVESILLIHISDT